MKKYPSVLFSLIISISILFCAPFAAYALTISQFDESGSSDADAMSLPVAIDGTHYFDDFQRRAATTYKKASLTRTEMRSRGRLDISDAFRFDVQGNVQNFWTRNIAANQNEEIGATCARAGKNCYIYVANNVKVEDAYLDRLLTEFDNNIYANDTACFGSEWKPGIDNDNHVTLLLLDIKDGMEGSNAFVAGYFFAGDEYSKSQYPNSNEREMIYMDVVQGAINNEAGFKRFCGTIAHEFQHMIHWHNDAKETTWVNESMAQYASFVNGYGHPGQISAYFKAPDTSLTAWRKDRGLANYGAIYMFSYYLVHVVVDLASGGDRQKKLSFTRALVSNPAHGIDGVVSTLAAFGVTKPFNDIYLDWLTTNAVNNKKISKRFGYGDQMAQYLPVARRVHGSFPVNRMAGTLDAYGGLYIVCSVDPEYLKNANLGADVQIAGIQNGGYVLHMSLATGQSGGAQLKGRLLKVKFDGTYSGDDFIIGPDNNYAFAVPGFPSEYKTLIFTFGVVAPEQAAAAAPTYNYAYDFVPANTNLRYMVSAYNQLASDGAMSATNKQALMNDITGGILASIATNEGAEEFSKIVAGMNETQKPSCARLLGEIKKKAAFESVQSPNTQNENLLKAINVLETGTKK